MLKTFETQRGAERWARSFDHARRCNALPPLEVEWSGADWIVVNPNADARAKEYREP